MAYSERTPRIWVAEHFTAEPAHFKSKKLFQFLNIASTEYSKFLYERFFLIMTSFRS